MRNLGFSILMLVVVLCLLLGPYIILLAASFGERALLQFPPQGFTFSWYSKLFGMRMFIDALKTSLLIGIASTLTGLVFGIPAAYATARFSFKGKDLAKLIFLSPAIIPGLVIGYSLLRFFVMIGGFPILIGLYLGHVALVFPYTIRVVLASLKNLDPSIDEAAISLGAAPWKVLFRVVLPNIRSGIIAAFILAFITSFNNVPVSMFLTGPGVTMLPVQMLSYVEYYYDPTIAALSTLLILLTVVIVQIVEKTLGLSQYF